MIVEGVNRVKKHTKVVRRTGRAGTTGGIITTEGPDPRLNVMLVEARGVTRIGSAKTGHQAPPDGSTYENQRSVRISRKTGQDIDDRDQQTGPPHEAHLKTRAIGESRAAERVRPRNVVQCPRPTKIVVNMGVGEAVRDSKLIEVRSGPHRDHRPEAAGDQGRKSIAQFKLREGMPIGAHVTLRGDRMWEFLDRLLSLALPRIRDFRWPEPEPVRRPGNYTFGLTEQVMFHEIDQDRIDRSRGMDITIVTTANDDDGPRAAHVARHSRSRRTDMAKTA